MKKIGLLIIAFILASVLLSAGAFVGTGRSETEMVMKITPSVLFMDLDGDKEKFEEDHWTSRNQQYGLSDFNLLKEYKNGDSLELEARAIEGNHDYLVEADFEKEGIGGLLFEFKEFRKYYDGTGGYYSPFGSTAKSLNYVEIGKGLNMDMTNFKLEGVYAKEGAPKYNFAYERELKEGRKSLISWGTVTGAGSVSKNINPTFLEVNETVDKLEAGVEHKIKGATVSAQQTWEHVESTNHKINNQTLTLSTGAISSVRTKDENLDFDRYTTILRMAQEPNQKSFFSLGVLYSHYIGGTMEYITDTSTSAYNENHPLNPARVEQDTVTVLPRVSFSPSKNMLVDGGLKVEFVNKNGSATYNRDYRNSAGTSYVPDGTIDELVNIKSERQEKKLAETLKLKYNGIKNTAFYAGADFEQQLINQFETQDAFGPNPSSTAYFSRDSDIGYYDYEFTAGFKWYPISQANITAEYKNKNGNRNFNNFFRTGDVEGGYRGFIHELDFTSHTPIFKLNYKPVRWIACNAGYTFDTTTYGIKTYGFENTEYAKYRAHIYSAGVTLTPYDCFYTTLFYQRRNAATKTPANGEGGGPYNQPTYNANVDVGSFACSYAPNAKTAIRGGYSISRADNFNDFSATGLPLGLDNLSQDISIGLEQKLRKDCSLEFKYDFMQYRENSNNGIDNYDAHLFYTGLKMEF